MSAIRSARWQVPQIVYPDQQDLVGYDTSGRWTLPPLEPRIEGTAVFLTNERAISYAESVMGIVEHYRLGEIIGRPTAVPMETSTWCLFPAGSSCGSRACAYYSRVTRRMMPNAVAPSTFRIPSSFERCCAVSAA